MAQSRRGGGGERTRVRRGVRSVGVQLNKFAASLHAIDPIVQRKRVSVIPKKVAPIKAMAMNCGHTTSFLPSIGSSLPQDSCVFQWDGNAVTVRYHSRRIVR